MGSRLAFLQVQGSEQEQTALPSGRNEEPEKEASSLAGRLVVEPAYPITVRFLEDGDEWVLDTEKELAQNMEWFDSRDPNENARVLDREGRAVELVVEEHQVKVCRIREDR